MELWLPICFLGAIIFFHFMYPTALASLASRVASPFWSGRLFLQSTLHEAISFFASKRELADSVSRLSAKLEQAQSLLSDRELLLSENLALKEQFGRTSAAKGRLIGAILATPPQSVYDTAIVDVGSNDGVEVGDLALSGSAILGVVSKTFARTSLVEFFSTAGKQTPVVLLHEGQALQVEAEGKGGGEFRATLPRAVSIFVGDPVVMPGFNPLAFATVEAIEGSATDSFQAIRFRNPVSIQALRFLEIQKAGADE